ncbi:MAG: glycoside hydrolase family 9 protein [Candidatus Brocadiia bacterium]
MKHCVHLLWIILLLLPTAPSPVLANQRPHFVDLSEAANADLEDDGLRDNGQGGWTDEGINDMYLYPPLPLGENVYNGFPFRVIDPADNDGRSVLILRGRERCQDRPMEAEVELRGVTGRYAFFMQHAAADVGGPLNYRVATYTVRYADGTRVEIPIRSGLEIQQWWLSRSKNDLREGLRWPVHYGQNVYTQKWNAKIGVWATRWENPHPDRPIAALRFRSEGKDVPIIFAVTISDTDFRPTQQEPELPAIPEGYFERKIIQENEHLYRAMVEEGHVEGIRRLEVIRPDLLAVTVDGGLTRSGIRDFRAEDYQKPEEFAVASETDQTYADGVHPARVGRFSYERWNGQIGIFPGNTLYWHTYYLYLPKPLERGHDYTVTVRDMDPQFGTVADLHYDDRRSVSRAIKVNQVAYSPLARRRYAYLGWWAEDAGAVDYSDLKRFRVVDEETGEAALEGSISLRESGDQLSGEDVYEMDISALGPGRYHVHVPGFARSDSFRVGGEAMQELHFHTMRAFFHQRCGQELRPPWTWVERGPCHLWCWESGYLVGNEDYEPKPGEEKRRFVGGYHDAADFDCFTYHLKATAQTLAAFEQFPDAFTDGDLSIPESGNGIPDVLDEAVWALSFYHDNQRPDGGVPLGRGNDCDAFAQQTGGRRPPFGVLPVRPGSCTEYAATAAHLARLIEPFAPDRAAEYLDSARRAYLWAAEHLEPAEGGNLRAWAAAELFRATGEEQYHEDFLRLFRAGALQVGHPVHSQHAGVFLTPYILCERPGVDEQVQTELLRRLRAKADALGERAEWTAYRMSHGGRGAFLGAGTGNGGGFYADACLRAYWLTGEQEYLDTACLNADFQLGCNPLSKTFITSMGARPPRRPMINRQLIRQGRPYDPYSAVKGLTVYGLAAKFGDRGYPSPLPAWRRWPDLWGAGAMISSEFTIHQTIGPSAMLYASLLGMENQ